MEKIKLEKKELDLINQNQEQHTTLINNLGVLTYQKQAINKQIEHYSAELEKLEQDLYQTLYSKYGEGTIDLDNGVFITSK